MPELTKALMNLEFVTIYGLFFRTDVEIKLNDNRLILVGENGSGKSTILNMLYLFLTAQWDRLVKLPFREVRMKINGELLSLKRSEMTDPLQDEMAKMLDHFLLRRRRTFTNDARSSLLLDLQRLPPHVLITHPEEIQRIAQVHDVETDEIQELIYYRMHYHRSNDSPRNRKLESLEKSILKHLSSQVLFLPTYRRIERDLKAIFPHVRLEKELQRFHRLSATRSGCIELVEFGMKDVELTFAKKMQALGDSLRADLDDIGRSYPFSCLAGERTGPPFKPCMRISRTRLTDGLSVRCITQPPGT